MLCFSNCLKQDEYGGRKSIGADGEQSIKPLANAIVDRGAAHVEAL